MKKRNQLMEINIQSSSTRLTQYFFNNQDTLDINMVVIDESYVVSDNNGLSCTMLVLSYLRV